MTILLAIDDTDIKGSRGTGRVARSIADAIGRRFPVAGVTRHQLLVHPDIPYTSHNSCAVIEVGASGKDNLVQLFSLACQAIRSDFVTGSDPGVAAAEFEAISPAMVAFGKDAQRAVLTQRLARDLAKNCNILLEGLGGTEDGVIGAMAGLGLASTRNDGRFIKVGSVRGLTGPHSVEELLNAGIDLVSTTDGRIIASGMVWNPQDKSTKPCPVNGRAVLFVEERNGCYTAVRRD